MDLSDFQPPQKAPRKRRKLTLKKAPFWLPKLGFRAISLGPPLFVWFGHRNGPKNDRTSDPKWTPKLTSKRRQKNKRKSGRKRSEKGSKNGPLFETCLISEREARLNTKPVNIKPLHVVANPRLSSQTATLCILSSLRALSSLRSFPGVENWPAVTQMRPSRPRYAENTQIRSDAPGCVQMRPDAPRYGQIRPYTLSYT